MLILSALSIAFLLLFPGLGESAQSPEAGVESGGKVWVGQEPSVSVKEIALRVAPILWFTGEEPHNLDGHLTPMVLPCDDGYREPTVYYQRTDVNRDSDTLTLQERVLTLEYYFYYLWDYGARCHSNDLESVSMRLSMRELDKPAGSYAVSLDSVVGAAHGSPWYANRLDLSKGVDDMSLPPTLLVEEGKHAVAPDRNADGWYTPGYDVNDMPNDAWGVRDVMGSGYAWGNAYRTHMTKPRHGKHRIMANANHRQHTLWSSSYNSTWWKLPERTYSLRRLPAKCEIYQDEPEEVDGGCKAMSVRSLLREKGIQDKSNWRELADALTRLFTIWQLRYQPSREHLGKSVGFRFAPIPNSLGPGWLTTELWTYLPPNEEREDVRRTIGGPRVKYFRPDTEVAFVYSPSVSRPVDWYIGGGFAIGMREVTVQELAEVEQWNQNPPPEEGPKTAGQSVREFGEIGVEFRWRPHFVIGGGVRYYGRRGATPVFKVGFGR